MGKQGRFRIPGYQLLPFETIVAAKAGDPDALMAVLKHFRGYINTRATREFYDENGLAYSGIDPELKQRLEINIVPHCLEKCNKNFVNRKDNETGVVPFAT